MSSQMRGLIVSVCVLATVLAGAAHGQGQFRAKTADKYPTKQKQGDLIVAVRPFVSDKDQQSAFGKLRPYDHGVTPLLVVM